jgi:hypothetical protein
VARWHVDIQKKMGSEYWTNRYIVEATTKAAAVVIGQSIVDAELDVHTNYVTIDKYRVSDGLPNTDVYSIVTIGQTGVDVAGASYLPLFNCVRVDFNVADGRPSRKYLRLPLLEDDVLNGELTSGKITAISTNYASVLFNLAGYVDVDGQTFTGFSVIPAVAMRQLRRGSKRRTEEVIP